MDGLHTQGESHAARMARFAIGAVEAAAATLVDEANPAAGSVKARGRSRYVKTHAWQELWTDRIRVYMSLLSAICRLERFCDWRKAEVILHDLADSRRGALGARHCVRHRRQESQVPAHVHSPPLYHPCQTCSARLTAKTLCHCFGTLSLVRRCLASSCLYTWCQS